MIRLALALTLTLAAPFSTAAQESIRVSAAVESQRVYVGQVFAFQIQVDGSDSPEAPDLSALRADFTIEDAGGGSNNSQSITIVNGQMQRTVREGYTFNYRLKAKRQGTLTIPSLTIRAGQASARTNSFPIQVLPPTEMEDFKLRQTLSKNRVYVGQPVTLTTTWYIGRNVDRFEFESPILSDDRFLSLDPKHIAGSAQASDYVEIPVGDRRALAKKGRGQFDGYDFVTLSFDKTLIPKQAGNYTLPAASVSFRALSQRRSSRSMFDDFLSGSLFGTRPAYENLAIPSNQPTLQVLPLPDAGRPSDFSGLIGEFEFLAEAKPTEVNVGDPITLTLTVSSDGLLDFVKLPNLNQQPQLTSEFKVPEEMGPGETQGDAKIFTQTIRARTPRTDAIPPLRFSYFDPERAAYVTAETDAIPVTVHGTRVVTAADAEGLGQDLSQSAVETAEGGIAQNYEAPDALEDQAIGLGATLRSPLWLTLLFGPPLVYLGLLGWRLRGPAAGNPREQAAREAYQSLLREIEQSQAKPAFAADVLGALRSYLGKRLELPPGALTYRDVRAPLAARGLDAETLQQLEQVFRECEAARYAGGAMSGAQAADLAEATRNCAQRIEATLGGAA